MLSKGWYSTVLPASPPSRPPKGSCKPSLVLPWGFPFVTSQHCCPRQLQQGDRVTGGASSCWPRCGCASGSPSTSWSYSLGSGPPLGFAPHWQSSCRHLCRSHRKEHGPVLSEPGRDSSCALGDGAPVRTGNIAGCHIHHIQTWLHQSPHRHSSPDSPRLRLFLSLQPSLDYSSQIWGLNNTYEIKTVYGSAIIYVTGYDAMFWISPNRQLITHV